MPEPAHKEHDQDVPVFFLISSKWKVQIFRKPLRQRDVPSLPEIPAACCKVRSVKVLRQPDTKQPCRTDCDMGIPGEIAIDLKCERHRCQQ